MHLLLRFVVALIPAHTSAQVSLLPVLTSVYLSLTQTLLNSPARYEAFGTHRAFEPPRRPDRDDYQLFNPTCASLTAQKVTTASFTSQKTRSKALVSPSKRSFAVPRPSCITSTQSAGQGGNGNESEARRQTSSMRIVRERGNSSRILRVPHGFGASHYCRPLTTAIIASTCLCLSSAKSGSSVIQVSSRKFHMWITFWS